MQRPIIRVLARHLLILLKHIGNIHKEICRAVAQDPAQRSSTIPEASGCAAPQLSESIANSQADAGVSADLHLLENEQTAIVQCGTERGMIHTGRLQWGAESYCTQEGPTIQARRRALLCSTRLKRESHLTQVGLGEDETHIAHQRVQQIVPGLISSALSIEADGTLHHGVFTHQHNALPHVTQTLCRKDIQAPAVGDEVVYCFIWTNNQFMIETYGESNKNASQLTALDATCCNVLQIGFREAGEQGKS